MHTIQIWTLIRVKEKCFKHGTKISENDESGHPIIHRNIKRPKILKFVLKSIVDKLNINKVVDPDGILIEMFSALNDLGIDKVTDIINDIYDNVDRPK